MLEDQAAQNQHYVPDFILRHFLSNEKKEQVTVFQKPTGKHICWTSATNRLVQTIDGVLDNPKSVGPQ